MTLLEKDDSIDHLGSALATYTREEPAPSHTRRHSLQEIVRRANSDSAMLEHELKEIERRLGTTAERPGDLDRAATIGHLLTNQMCLAVLMQGIESGV
jgi:hypothetical protein